MPNMIDIVHLNKYFGDLHVLKDVSLSVREGEKVVLIGPSGSGKSTLIRSINWLEEPSSGEVRINGELMTKKNHLEVTRKYTSMVFQQFNLYPNMTVMGNLTLAPIKLQKKTREEAEAEAMRNLKRVGLAHKADEYPQNLSGGQQQRVAIARALAMNPKMILFDEPTSALDPELVGGVLDVMRDLAHNGMSMVIVTHEMAFARDVSDRIVFMADSIVQEDTTPAEFFSHPKTERARNFLSRFLS